MRLKEIFYPESRFGGFSDVDGSLRFYSRVRSLIAPESVVLDIGCGSGERIRRSVPLIRDLSWFKGRCAKVIGIDVDPEGQTNPSLDEFRQIDSDRWPVDDESVDVCVSDFVLEHLEQPELFFQQSRRVLKPGGYLCIRTPNSRSYVALISRLVPNRFHTRILQRAQPNRRSEDVFPTVYRCNTCGRIRKQMRRYGFDHCVYGVEAEPSYLSFSRVLYALGVLHQRFAPGPIRVAIFAFGRKVGSTAERPL